MYREWYTNDLCTARSQILLLDNYDIYIIRIINNL